MKTAFSEAGFQVVEYAFPQSSVNTRNDEALTTDLAKHIMQEDADAVFSFNYFPVAAIAAAACKVKYISWTYDSPSVQLYSKTIAFPTNYAFVFDSYDVQRLQGMGVQNVYELPTAAANYDAICPSERERKAFSSEITMIGSMYTEEKHGFVKRLENLDEYAKGYVEGLVAAQKKIYGATILETGLTEEMVRRIQKVAPIEGHGDGYETAGWTLANYFLARLVTVEERRELLESLSEHHEVTLFTPSPTPNLPKVRNMGTLNYYEDAPKAMKCAKLNLNISLRSIVHGIPLRCMDVLGCGGFLLTNYQMDFEKYFTAGEEYAYFESREDLLDKADYYLKHDKEREQMAQAALSKVRSEHSFAKRLETILEVTGL
ncbi:MAG: glycosyltransferase [Lachnospiraceae bacterium]|nr:glycosyltransferase [Lachnospiraceae bacterium]